MGKIFYTKPAAEWEQALPVGCGRLGGMVFGGVEKEVIQVNEENMWYGGFTDRVNPDARTNLGRVRRYLSEGEIEKAERLLDIAFSSCPDSMRPYQTLGEIQILFDGFGSASERKSGKTGKLSLPSGVENYRRTLDMDRAVCTVNFTYHGTKYSREYFASHPRDCIVMRFSAEGGGTVDFTARLRRGRCFDGVRKTDRGIMLYGNLGKGGSDFAMELTCTTSEGEVKTVGECLCVSRAKQAVLYFTAVTDKYCGSRERDDAVEKFLAQKPEIPACYSGLCGYERREYFTRAAILRLLESKLGGILDNSASLGYDDILEEHIKDHGRLYGACSLRLHGDNNVDIPTDIRLEAFKEGKTDDGIFELLFDYGRYLTVACSRKGGLPSTLQGIWNKEFFPPWDSKYTININTEMNYWHAEMCNLAECHMPLFDLIDRIRANGRRVAEEMYGCRGFVAHHNTDIYGDSCPQDTWYAGTYWVMGAAWLCTHLWEHYRYSLDGEFLKRAFPVMAEAALFFIDFLTEKDGFLITSPSVSPENSYIGGDGRIHCCCEAAAMDNQILRELFSDCIKAWNALGKTVPEGTHIEGVSDIAALMAEIEHCLCRIAPVKVASDGRIMEWDREYGEAEEGHRHLSHLFALYPAGQITPYGTPSLAAAAEKTIGRRLSAGGGYTGWSRAWIINLYASLYNGEKAYGNLCEFVKTSVYPNLFDRHPPFQIDGNFGVCTAICRMLVQSSEGEVFLLPALPAEWGEGIIKGVRLVGNAEAELGWKDGALDYAVINALSPYNAQVFYNGKQVSVKLRQGESVKLLFTDFMTK